MNYYEVWISSLRYHKRTPLTYQHDSVLAPGSIVRVSLQKELVTGIILGPAKPLASMTIKPVSEVLALPPIPAPQLQLLGWLAEYYPAPIGLLTRLLLPSDIAPRDAEPSLPKKEQTPLPPLTKEQQQTLQQINSKVPAGSTAILHGETGSGKTRIYIELALQAQKQHKSALILTPEIGLTPQLELAFKNVFGSSVLVIHSNLTPVARRKLWLQILCATEPLVVIGPRSALFTPVKDLGLIIIDEAHDGSYKQEQAPYYQTTRVASKLAQLTSSICLFGSATPSVIDYYYAQAKGSPILRMQLQATSSTAQTAYSIVDLKDKAGFSRSSAISNTLIGAITDAMSKNQQSLLFLNRRGTARLMLCQNCGWHAQCPNCDIPYTYHGDTHTLQCHTCGRNESSPTACPDCHQTTLTLRNVGTKSIVDELTRLFPDARIARFDGDTKQSESVAANYSAIHAGDIDILVGTQMLAKGLDLPKLAVVGVVMADTSLFIPDFTAEEHTYQLLTQVMGRLSRHHVPGQLIVQSYNPENPLLQEALARDWNGFYTKQIEQRKLFHFPPFVHLLKLQYSAARPATVIKHAEQLAEKLHRQYPGLTILGPAPAFHEKAHGKHQWQIIIKATSRPRLTKIIQDLPSGWLYDIDPVNLL